MSNSLQLKSYPTARSLVAPTLFGELPSELRQRLLADAPRRRFDHEQIIQQKGDAPRGFWVIERGTVKVGQFSLAGEFRALALLAETDSYGELAVLAGNRRAVDAVAEGEVDLRWIDAAAFERAIEGDSDTMRRLVGALAIELQETLTLAAGLGRGNSAARVAAILVNLAGPGPLPKTIKLGQQELGELTGLTRVTINKCLAGLEQDGIVRRRYGRIDILNMAALTAASVR